MQLFRRPANFSHIQQALFVGIESQVYIWVGTNAAVAPLTLQMLQIRDLQRGCCLQCRGAGPGLGPGPSGAAGAPQEALRQRLPLPQGVTTVQGPHPEGRELHLEFVGRSLQSDFFHSVHQSVLSLMDAVLFLRARRC